MTSLLISFNKQLLSIFSVENSLFYIYNILNLFTKYQGASLVAQSVKNLPAMQETQVQFLGQEDPLEKEMETHSSILDWRIPWTEGAWWTTVHGVTKSRTQLKPFSMRVHQWSETRPWLFGFAEKFSQRLKAVIRVKCLLGGERVQCE